MVSVWLALAVVLSLDQWCSPLVGGVPTEDPGRYLTVAQGWMEGLMPYRDLFDHKGPLVYVFHLFALFGGVRLFGRSACSACCSRPAWPISSAAFLRSHVRPFWQLASYR